MRRFVIQVEQTFQVIAETFEQASEELPTYPTTNDPKWEIVDETMELLYTEAYDV